MGIESERRVRLGVWWLVAGCGLYFVFAFDNPDVASNTKEHGHKLFRQTHVSQEDAYDPMKVGIIKTEPTSVFTGCILRNDFIAVQLGVNTDHSVFLSSVTNVLLRHPTNPAPPPFFPIPQLFVLEILVRNDNNEEIVKELHSNQFRLERWHVDLVSATFSFVLDEYGLDIVWTCKLSENNAFIDVAISRTLSPLSIPSMRDDRIQLVHVEVLSIDVEKESYRITGVVQGVPVVLPTSALYFGVQHPMSNISIHGKFVRARMPLYRSDVTENPVHVVAAFGAYSDGHLRRDFSAYIERIRANPWRQWLHYNSWYQLRRPASQLGVVAPEDEMNLTNVLRVLKNYRDDFVRPVNINNFRGILLDDGWDNYTTLWQAHSGFPGGFSQIKDETIRSDLGGVGVWLSPWGGYGHARGERMKYGRTQGFEINSNGFSLAGKNYFNRFYETCKTFILEFDVSFFKFDGIAGGFVTSGPPPEFAADVFGLFELVTRLRKLKKTLFINLTVGTWPSPYFLLYADSIWRGELDTGGWGSGRRKQRWITYRDEVVSRLVVQRSELYPLSSLMLHGIVYGDVDDFAKQAMSEPGLDEDVATYDFSCEVWSFFATGANLQELYLTPRLMTGKLWQIVQQATIWSQKNADVLHDSHWIGGDVRIDEAYGFAAYDIATRRGVLSLRNPHNNKAAELKIEPRRDLDMGNVGDVTVTRTSCTATLTWGEPNPSLSPSDREASPIITTLPRVSATDTWEIKLAPQQVVVYEITCSLSR
eukprot:m.167703 g.167703  ORF g.167703 m.167703 type:complete len:761 (+) comp31472_c0_seq1:175-2457(+)